jgi:hypothetical protein
LETRSAAVVTLNPWKRLPKQRITFFHLEALLAFRQRDSFL